MTSLAKNSSTATVTQERTLCQLDTTQVTITPTTTASAAPTSYVHIMFKSNHTYSAPAGQQHNNTWIAMTDDVNTFAASDDCWGNDSVIHEWPDNTKPPLRPLGGDKIPYPVNRMFDIGNYAGTGSFKDLVYQGPKSQDDGAGMLLGDQNDFIVDCVPDTDKFVYCQRLGSIYDKTPPPDLAFWPKVKCAYAW